MVLYRHRERVASWLALPPIPLSVGQPNKGTDTGDLKGANKRASQRERVPTPLIFLLLELDVSNSRSAGAGSRNYALRSGVLTVSKNIEKKLIFFKKAIDKSSKAQYNKGVPRENRKEGLKND